MTLGYSRPMDKNDMASAKRNAQNIFSCFEQDLRAHKYKTFEEAVTAHQKDIGAEDSFRRETLRQFNEMLASRAEILKKAFYPQELSPASGAERPLRNAS